MAGSSERIQDALAAHLDYIEMGGPEPDISHLSAAEKKELAELIESLELTEGVALGRGRDDAAPRPEAAPSTAEGQTLLSQLREALGPGVRIDTDPNTLVAKVGGIEIVDRWLIGTFGGRVRLWLLDAASAREVEDNADCLADLNRVFRMFPDMSAVGLIGRDLSCLIVEPQDCAPRIQVPSGSLVSRRFNRALQPAVDAVSAFIDELIPYWDPMPAFDPNSDLTIDIAEIGDDFARTAVEAQRGIGERARKGNPKKDVLLGFGRKEITAIAALTKGLFDGSIEPGEVEERIERSAGAS